MNAICPVSSKQVTKAATRITASFTFVLLLIFLVSQWLAFIFVLALDFYIRAIDRGAYSPLNMLSGKILKVLSVKPRSTNAGPKIFAARVGFFFCVLIVLLWALGFHMAANVFAVVLALFSFLEAAFGFCMACTIYPFVYRITYRHDYQGK
jgi:hypothetical protein